MTSYVCVELAPMQNGYIACKTWAVLQSPLADLAITSEQALQLSTVVASLFLMVKAYKIVKKSLNTI